VDAAPRLRIAPSPTGYFHVGTGRTAIFNWLEARRTGGTFVLRIEDTDTERHVQEAVDGIQRAMAWLGIGWDEGPYFASANRERHVEVALRLAEQGLAYWSDPMPLASDGKPIQYDGRDRDKDLPRAEGRALRFRTPRDGAEVVHDLVRGEPTFAHDTIEDFALLRGNGEPLFILGNVVDDLDERISIVARGEDHLSNTPKYQLLWQAVAPEVPLPTFAHLPLIVNDKRRKLSKRKGDKVAVEAFRDEGYLPEVLAGFLCLLGWSPSDGRERFTIEEVVGEFALADVVSNPAFFDQKKLDAFNGEAIRAFAPDRFRAEVEPFFGDRPVARVAELLPEVQTRIVRLAEAPELVDFLYAMPAVVEDDWAKAVRQTEGATAALLDAVAGGWEACAWDAEAVKQVLVGAGEAHGLNLKKAQAPVRVALTGRAVGPPLFESVVVLGRDEATARVRAVRARLES
jgi:glutamyl-tRNA synthetase